MGRAGLALLMTACTSAGATSRPAAAETGVGPQPLITYCDLVGSPLKYLGKEVRVVGIYRVGFEWQELYSTRCPDGYSTWVEWVGAGDSWCDPSHPKIAIDSSETTTHQTQKAIELEGATYGLIARGTVTGADGVGYGHLNGFTFQFNLRCIDSMEFLDENSYHVHVLTRDMRRKIEKFLARTDPAKARPQ
jgi:hypothetical protein